MDWCDVFVGWCDGSPWVFVLLYFHCDSTAFSHAKCITFCSTFFQYTCYQECTPAKQRLLWESLADDSWQMQDRQLGTRAISQPITHFLPQPTRHSFADWCSRCVPVWRCRRLISPVFPSEFVSFSVKATATPITCSFFNFSRRILFKIILSLMIVVDKIISSYHDWIVY